MELSFFEGKRVFVTGHTGFKGSWLCQILKNAGAQLTGYALAPPTSPNLFETVACGEGMTSIIGDICDADTLREAFQKANPEIVIHMAAQPLVRESYKNPTGTYATNVMGTVNILECLRLSGKVRSFLNVTTDKVYLNKEWEWGYRENDPLDGFDPYSNSKSCSELVTHSYKSSFFSGPEGPVISTARAGNVIGGGDFAADRIVPDCVRAAAEGNTIIVRNPHSTRPYQHVLEPLFAYLHIVQQQWENPALAGWYNVGPDDKDCVTTGQLVETFCEKWGRGIRWEVQGDGGPHEANFLKLDCSKMKASLGWNPVWGVDMALEKTVEWTHAFFSKQPVAPVMELQIQQFIQEKTW